MRGLSVFFIASILPSLIKGVGEIYGHFCGSNFCGKDAKDCPGGPRVHKGVTCVASGMSPIVGNCFHEIGGDYNLCEAEFAKLSEADKALFEKIGHVEDPKGPLSPEDARPYDVDKPLFREKSKERTCPRDDLAGCAFVDHVHTVRPFASPPPPLGTCSLHRRKGALHADLRRRAHGPGDDHAQLHVGLHVRRDRQRADGVLREARPRPTHDARVDLLHVHQPAPSRRWPSRREPRMVTLGGESSAALAQARRWRRRS